MSASELNQLTIEHLRGSVAPFSLTFEKGKKLTVVYGENATGKSTICDALDFIGNGRIGSLENRGLGKTSKYWGSVGKKASDVAVVLQTRGGSTCRASIAKGEVVVLPGADRPRIEVLRRSQILALVDAIPGKKYDALSRFIDVSGVEASESALRQHLKYLTASRESAVARIDENERAIKDFWDSAGKLGDDPEAWAAVEVRRDTKSADAEVAALTTLEAAYSRLGDYPSRWIAVNLAVAEAKLAEAAARQAAVEIVKSIAADAAEVMNLLASAHEYLEKHPVPTACPLCESSEKVEGLARRTSERLSTFEALQAAQATLTLTGANLRHSEQQLATLQASAIDHARQFDIARVGFAWSADIPMPASPVPAGINTFEEWLRDTAALPVAWRAARVSREGNKQFIDALKKALRSLNENVQAQKDLDALLPRLARALEVVAEERRVFSDGILAQIANEVGRLYELVHPGEGLNKISLQLDPAKRASLEIGASFCGKEGEPPQAYFSESHLDTLGLCVFLALAALDSPESTILVLDDVLASVDEPHVERMIEMLYAEATRFRHCVITTHYRPWKQKLRWGWLKNGQCQFVELSKWTDTGGISLTRSIPDVERLRDLLAETPPDPQLVCAKAGVILEAALDFLTQLYECAVPRRSGGLYTLGDLLPAIDKKLRKALTVEVLVEAPDGVLKYESRSLTATLEELTRIAQARNVFGCHFSAISFELLESDALGFGQQVLALIDVLADQEAGWPAKSKSGSYWANSGETRRLHPLRQPS